MGWVHRGMADRAGIALKADFASSGEALLAGLILMEVSQDRQLMSRGRLCGMAYAFGMTRLPSLTGTDEHITEIMNETNTTVTPTAPTTCACSGPAKAQPTAAPAAQPQAQPVAAAAPAAPKAAKRNSRKR